MKPNFKNLYQKKELGYASLDLVMLYILLLNLTFIAFDWIFESQMVQDTLHEYTPTFYYTYSKHIHRNFNLIDLVFITIYLAEFFFRWGVSIYHQRFHKWFFFPFVYWYDLLGCIPAASFRMLRLLRVGIILYRWQRNGIIDLKETYLGKTVIKYYDIIMEEITDKVIVNILGTVQDEIRVGSPLTDKIINEVIRPRKEVLVEWISHRISTATQHVQSRHHHEIRRYVDIRVTESMVENPEVMGINKIPLVGSLVTSRLQSAVSDIVYGVINRIIEDLSSVRSREAVDDVAEALFEAIIQPEKDQHLNQVAIDMVVQSLELIKQQVMIKQWKLKELEGVIMRPDKEIE